MPAPLLTIELHVTTPHPSRIEQRDEGDNDPTRFLTHLVAATPRPSIRALYDRRFIEVQRHSIFTSLRIGDGIAAFCASVNSSETPRFSFISHTTFGRKKETK